ncbi:MAG: CatB-related O-acetyltransferase [Bdellovibrio sp.]
MFISKSVVGNYNYIGHFSVIDSTVLGNYCSIGAGAMIGGAEHPYQWWSTSFRLGKGAKKPQTVIEDDVWIGAKSTLRAGIRVGRGAVIGAHTLVLKDVPPYSIVVGSPARTLRERFNQKQIAKVEQTRYWEKNPREAMAILRDIDSKD